MNTEPIPGPAKLHTAPLGTPPPLEPIPKTRTWATSTPQEIIDDIRRYRDLGMKVDNSVEEAARLFAEAWEPPKPPVRRGIVAEGWGLRGMAIRAGWTDEIQSFSDDLSSENVPQQLDRPVPKPSYPSQGPDLRRRGNRKRR